MWWLVLSIVPALLSLFGCADNRPVEHQPKKKKPQTSAETTRSNKSTKSTTTKRRRRRRKGKSVRSSKSGKSAKGSAKSGRSSKKSSKSGKKSGDKSGKKDSSKSTKPKNPDRSSKTSKSSKSKKSRKIPKEVEIKSVKPAVLSKEEIVGENIVKPLSAEAVVQPPLVKPPPAIVDVVVPASEPVATTPCITEGNCVKVHAEPAEMNFKPTGGLKEFKIVNDSDETRLFKIKCTDNQLYRVSPVVGHIEPHQTIAVDILRQNGSIKVDKLVLVTAKAKKSDKEGTVFACQKTVVPLLVDV